MEKENEREKLCENCRFYRQHYTKRYTKFNITSCGHCTENKRRNEKTRVCERWEDIAIRQAEQRTAIKETLREMEKHLREMALILKDE